MKYIKYGIILCVLFIVFKLIYGVASSMNGNYDPKYAQDAAKFFVLLVPLVVIFLFVKIGRAVFKRDNKGG